ncbi:hypothetical protein ACOMHN_050527 [Nucella lapillus]
MFYEVQRLKHTHGGKTSFASCSATSGSGSGRWSARRCDNCNLWFERRAITRAATVFGRRAAAALVGARGRDVITKREITANTRTIKTEQAPLPSPWPGPSRRRSPSPWLAHLSLQQAARCLSPPPSPFFPHRNTNPSSSPLDFDSTHTTRTTRTTCPTHTTRTTCPTHTTRTTCPTHTTCTTCPTHTTRTTHTSTWPGAAAVLRQGEDGAHSLSRDI